MNKENSRSAAGLRRSALAERIRLREEWSELKGTDNVQLKTSNVIKVKRALMKPGIATKTGTAKKIRDECQKKIAPQSEENSSINEVLRGVVALVEVGSEARALPLRAALTALGASVVPTWSPIVTHLIWAQGGSRWARSRSRALGVRVVSPLWVEASAAAARRPPDSAFPPAARPSDTPSPRTLRRLLIRAEKENIPFHKLLEKDDDKEVMPRLRLSSENDSSHDTTNKNTIKNTSHDTTGNTSADTSGNTTVTDVETRVNTAPRRALPLNGSPKPAKSRRKLFTHKEADDSNDRASDDESEEDTRVGRPRAVLPVDKEIPRAAKKILATFTSAKKVKNNCKTRPYIVLTGMCRCERQSLTEAIRSLDGRIQTQVTKKTTHVLLGSCHRDSCHCSGVTATSRDTGRTRNSPEEVLAKNMDISGVSPMENMETRVVHRSEIVKARTLNALLGAARGCRVLTGRWAERSALDRLWTHPYGYEVPHLKKISQKARVERAALGRMRSEYAYDVFNSIRVRITDDAEQRDAAIQLLKLCGAVVQDGGNQDGREQQNGGQDVCDITVGVADGEVSSKWVFDSVAAGRMRTTRRYVNNVSFTEYINTMSTNR